MIVEKCLSAKSLPSMARLIVSALTIDAKRNALEIDVLLNPEIIAILFREFLIYLIPDTRELPLRRNKKITPTINTIPKIDKSTHLSIPAPFGTSSLRLPNPPG